MPFRGPDHGRRDKLWNRELCRILLPDSGHLQEEEARFLNKHKASKHSPALPLYTQKDAENCLSQFHSVDFEKVLDLNGGIQAALACR